MKIVVVEDDRGSRQLIKKLCRGHEVITHASPDDLFNETAWEGADLAVVDLVYRTGSGKVSGLDLLIWLGQHFPGLPRVVVTGFVGLDRDVLRGMSDHLLIKPINIAEFRSILTTVDADVTSGPPPPPEPEPMGDVWLRLETLDGIAERLAATSSDPMAVADYWAWKATGEK